MVAAVNSLALDERVERLKAQYFPEGKEKSLDEKGKSHLHSLLDDFGYEETGGIFARTRNNSIDIFIERDLDKKDKKFTYLCLTSPKEVLEFQERCSEYINDENTRVSEGIGIGLVTGIIGGVLSVIPSIETYLEIKDALREISEQTYTSLMLKGDAFIAETSFGVAVSLPIVVGGIIGYIHSQDWKNDKERSDKEFREKYLVADKKYAVGKMAVESALSSSS